MKSEVTKFIVISKAANIRGGIITSNSYQSKIQLELSFVTKIPARLPYEGPRRGAEFSGRRL